MSNRLLPRSNWPDSRTYQCTFTARQKAAEAKRILGLIEPHFEYQCAPARPDTGKFGTRYGLCKESVAGYRTVIGILVMEDRCFETGAVIMYATLTDERIRGNTVYNNNESGKSSDFDAARVLRWLARDSDLLAPSIYSVNTK